MTLVGLARNGRVAIVAIDDPPFNAIASPLVIGELQQTIDSVLDDELVDAIVVRGTGGCFSAGHALAEPAAAPADAGDAAARAKLLDKIDHSSKPVVMALHGQASGLGFELALAGHFRFAAPGTKLACGMPPDYLPPPKSIFRLTHIVGADKALDLLISRREIDAEEARAMGLVDRLVDSGYDAVVAAESLVGSQMVHFSDRRADLDALARWRDQLAGSLQKESPSRHIFDGVEAAIFGARRRT